MVGFWKQVLTVSILELLTSSLLRSRFGTFPPVVGIEPPRIEKIVVERLGNLNFSRILSDMGATSTMG